MLSMLHYLKVHNYCYLCYTIYCIVISVELDGVATLITDQDWDWDVRKLSLDIDSGIETYDNLVLILRLLLKN